MILLWHILAAVIVAIVVLRMGSPRALYTILGLVVLELVAVAVLADTWGLAAAASFFVVVAPWAVVASFVYLMRGLKGRAIVATLVPIIYLASFAVSVVVGVNTGAMPP